MDWKREFFVVASSLVLALPASGQAPMSGGAGTPTDSRNAPATRMSSTTTESGVATLVFLHRANQDEIELANLAKDKSSNKAVKDYAELIIKDHKKADDEVQSFAKAHNIDLKRVAQDLQAADEQTRDAVRSREVQTPTGEYMRPLAKESTAWATSTHKKAMENLDKLNGREFDRQFTRTMATDHHKLVERLTSARSNQGDRDLTQLIDKLLPTLQKHESTAQQLEERVSRAS